ncbi:MAG: S9 family peptidase [Melioribacteraceae bacterium]|nr:S9 family peptidase [Melioribacteraceae bacterium]MCF8355025.1 S9 family peptidase [Melioribacteraceae bacterium]MCF8392704.1 S9 family peptidase [Melioribacteraceae bacterium]MCF8417726.1 S9 family peptidase [Melioribacteraceae bacterium]
MLIKSILKSSFVLLFVIANFLTAQNDITLDWIFSGASSQISTTASYQWLSDGNLVILNYRKPASEREIEIYNPRTNETKPMFDKDQALESINSYLGEDKMFSLRWPDQISSDGKWALYLINGDIFLLSSDYNECIRVTETEAEEKSVNLSPDNSKLAFIRDNDLYAYDIDEYSEIRLTKDGSETLLNGTLSWVYWEEIFGRNDTGYWWSGDGESIAFLQTDDSPVSIMHYVDYRQQIPEVITQRYPKAGGVNPIVKVGVASLIDQNITWIDINDYEYVCRVNWLPDNKHVSIQTMNRMQTQLDLYFADKSTGKVKHILKETDTAWVNINDDLYFLKNSDRFIWGSERNGYAHLYLYDYEGNLINQITDGEWAVKSSASGVAWLRGGITAVNEESEIIYFTSQKESHLEKHLYKINFDGSSLVKLTQGEGTHAVACSPVGDFFVDKFNSASQPNSLKLFNENGELLETFAESRVDLVEENKIALPEIFTIEAEDGFDLPAMLYKPADFDEDKAYPLVVFIYGGPSAPQVQDSWTFWTYFNNVLLNEGYLVALIDNRSATGISKKLENTVSMVMSGPKELKDLVDAVRWFKNQKWIDENRVGIWGWSGGGSFTLNAMTNSTEFKAGIAVAAVSDWHYYDTKWAEFAMKTPDINPKGYEITSFVKSAKNLHGRLLLVHGTYDDNVHIQNAWAFADELFKAGKLFEMMIYPMRKHGISDMPAFTHLMKTMVDFWKRNL